MINIIYDELEINSEEIIELKKPIIDEGEK